MANSLPLLQLFILLSGFILCSASASSDGHRAYVVYMGGSSSIIDEADAELAHLHILSSIIPSEQSERMSLRHSYHHAFRGFSALLTEKEASAMSGHKDVVSVFPDALLPLHTTRSWDFLDTQSGIKSNFEYRHPKNDVIIGMIDTGIWPESPSFNDHGIGEIPSRWKGVCMEGADFKKSTCNRKLIGARYYNTIQMDSKAKISHLAKSGGSPRDSVGHGTHTASIASGSRVANASYYGLGYGTASGGSPSSRIAMYKACTELGCSSSAILKAFDDAIKDGVDIISISIGLSSIFQADFLEDPIAIGAFHATQKDVMVVCSAGNEGPDPSTVVNTAPWLFTVAASSIDRDFKSTILLGNGKSFQGSAISFSNLSRSKYYPLVYGASAAAKFTPISEARICYPGSLDRIKVAGKIVVCMGDDSSVSRTVMKLVVQDSKAKGVIIIDEQSTGSPFDSGTYPFSQLGKAAGTELLHYIHSTRNASATILPTVELSRVKPAPIIAYFSSRGPGGLTENILKPDITAPGVAILGATIPTKEEANVPFGEKISNFVVKSGTSMACPHVTGAAAFVKSVHPGWSASMIKSALMTTAMTSNNMRDFLTNSSKSYANLHEMGTGEISPLRALNPGLVFETRIEDHLSFLCYYGFSEKNVRAMSNTNFKCPIKSKEELVSNVNYPSISIGQLDSVCTVTRTVTNVGSANSTYVAYVHAPKGLSVSVWPKKLVFSGNMQKLSFKISFNGKGALKGYNFGLLRWTDESHSVRVMFAVNVV
ncbi:unnamed protein product [Rhodiola kirilowii]